jgi:hypothetical protein
VLKEKITQKSFMTQWVCYRVYKNGYGKNKGYLVKTRVFLIGKMYWQGGSTKGFWDVFNNIY